MDPLPHVPLAVTMKYMALPLEFDTTAGVEGCVAVACDGAAAGNPGPGGWAWYVDDARWGSGGAKLTTNNRMELTAVIEALRSIPGDVHLVCDSKYVVESATKWMHVWRRRGWRKSDGSDIANRDLIIELGSALRGRRVRFEWVRGHDGHLLNEEADKRARAAAESYRDAGTVDQGPGFLPGGNQ
jgi:ribonuclease HI